MCDSSWLVLLSPEGVLSGNVDVDCQMLEASKSGDLETVKVTIVPPWLPTNKCTLSWAHANLYLPSVYVVLRVS